MGEETKKREEGPDLTVYRSHPTHRARWPLGVYPLERLSSLNHQEYNHSSTTPSLSRHLEALCCAPSVGVFSNVENVWHLGFGNRVETTDRIILQLYQLEPFLELLG